jgi:hypothetical protein
LSFGNLYHDDPAPHRRNRGGSKGISGLLALVLTIFGAGFYLQSTLAANVSLNSGGAIEFGQGTARTVACSEGQYLIISPQSTFVNEAGAGSHKFSSIKVDNIPTACRGQDFTFSAYNNVASSAAQAIFNTSSTRAVVYMKEDDTFEVGIGGTGLSVTTNSASSFTVTFTAPVVASSSVFNLTVESAAHTVRPCSDGGACAIGETGPGGGVVFLSAASAGNSTGYNYEASLTNLVGTYKMCSDNISRNISNEIGAGVTNSAVLLQDSNCNISGTAAYGMNQYNIAQSINNAVDDWYIPSRDELLSVKSNVIDSFIVPPWMYMTSSQNSADSVFWVDFDTEANRHCGGVTWPLCTTYKNDSSNILKLIRRWQ